MNQTQLDRIEHKVDLVLELLGTLLQALAEDDEQKESTDLDGNEWLGGERDQTQSL